MSKLGLLSDVPFDDSYINHDLVDWTILLMTMSFALTLYGIIFYAIGFVFISRNKKYNQLIKKTNRNIILALFGPKDQTMDKSSTPRISKTQRFQHSCRFCDEESPLIFRQLFNSSVCNLIKMMAYICGLIGILANYSQWIFYLSFSVYFIISTLSIVYNCISCRSISRRLKARTCGFETICKLNDLLIMICTTVCFCLSVLFLYYYVTNDPNIKNSGL
jgi:hypothetical protein